MSRHATRHSARTGFAARLHEAIGAQTTENFARQVDVTLRTAQRWRNGESEPSGADLVRIAATLGRDPSWFYLDAEEPRAAA